MQKNPIISANAVAHIVTQSRHGGSTWMPPSDFHFTAADYSVALAEAEITPFADHLPFAFQHTEKGWQAVGIFGDHQNGNACLTLAGQWRAGYVPAAFRGYPFTLTEGEDAQLAILESAELLSGGYDGKAFFDASGNLAPLLEQTREFLIKIRQGRQRLSITIQELDSCGLLEPWNKLSGHVQAPADLPPLYGIDQRRFDALPDSQFIRLRRANAISLAYAQLHSRRKLGNLARLRQTPPPPADAATAGPAAHAASAGLTQGNDILALMNEELNRMNEEG